MDADNIVFGYAQQARNFHIDFRTERHLTPKGEEWTAIDDRTYDGPGSLMGWGDTEEEAKADLVRLFEERADYQEAMAVDVDPRAEESLPEYDERAD